jgi:hypothetical protein
MITGCDVVVTVVVVVVVVAVVVGVVDLKVAVTVASAVSVQAPLPLQPPLQPLKVLPEVGVAVRLTDVPLANDAVQVEPQLIPAGELVTVPGPLTVTPTVKLCLITVTVAVIPVKVAVTVAAELTVHVLVPVQLPLQPLKTTRTLLRFAVRTTEVPTRKLALHVAPEAQSMPAGELWTLPGPLTVTVTLKVPTNVAVRTGPLRRGADWPPTADPWRKPSVASATSGRKISTALRNAATPSLTARSYDA